MKKRTPIKPILTGEFTYLQSIALRLMQILGKITLNPTQEDWDEICEHGDFDQTVKMVHDGKELEIQLIIKHKS